ncbi:N-acetylneuraminate synthase family protein [Candidatus Omnitrophota bacterium]
MTEIIAEVGQNHNGDMHVARRLIHAAKSAGADVAKFQLYDAKKLFPKENNPWFDYNCKTELSRENVKYLKSECDRIGIEFMASVFDIKRIKWLEDLGVARHKMASRSIKDKELISALCETGKPLIISLGMWKGKRFPKFDTKAKVDYLYCISEYPAELSKTDLQGIDFTQYSGFSDHTIGISAAIFALSKGARIIEKHFTIDKGMYGPDHSCSMTPDELNQINNFRRDLKELVSQ